MELVNARRSRTVLTAANEGDIIAAVEGVPYSFHNMAQNWVRPKRGLSKYFATVNCIYTNSARVFSVDGVRQDASYADISLLAYRYFQREENCLSIFACHKYNLSGKW